MIRRTKTLHVNVFHIDDNVFISMEDSVHFSCMKYISHEQKKNKKKKKPMASNNFVKQKSWDDVNHNKLLERYDGLNIREKHRQLVDTYLRIDQNYSLI